MKLWLRTWLGVSGEPSAQMNAIAELQRKDWARMDAIETAISLLDASTATEINELRERLDTPRRRQPSGRPFTVLRSLAEMGAQKQNASR